MADAGARSTSEDPATDADRSALSAASPSVAERLAVGRPRVFGVPARAIPLSDGGGSLLDHGIDVALLMTPAPSAPFAMRAPRGALGSGRRFILRCPGMERQRGALARTTAVSEMGVHFDLISAELVVAADETQRSQGRESPTPSERHRPPVQAEPPDPHPGTAGPDARATRGIRLNQHASASAVQIGGVTTIDAEVHATVLTPVQMGQSVKLIAPRGEIPRGAYFALRYFDTAGAKRGLMRAEAVREQPGMLDEIEATLIRPPTQAEERQSYRATFERVFTADVQGPNGARTIRGKITDLSAGGIGFRVTSALAPGDRFRFVDPALGDIDGADLVVVRRDPRDPQRYGARFVEANRGETTLATILGLDRSDRERRRRAQIEATRRARGATAVPLSDADIRALRNARMGTRDHRASGHE